MKKPRIVRVEWVDAASDNTWQKLSSINSDEHICESIGYLLSKDKRQVFLAATIHGTKDDAITESGQTIQIPTGCIRKIKTLKE